MHTDLVVSEVAVERGVVHFRCLIYRSPFFIKFVCSVFYSEIYSLYLIKITYMLHILCLKNIYAFFSCYMSTSTYAETIILQNIMPLITKEGN